MKNTVRELKRIIRGVLAELLTIGAAIEAKRYLKTENIDRW